MKNEVTKVLFIVNRYSGKGYQPGVEGRIVDICGRHDAECTIEFTQGRGHATELAAEAASSKRFDRVVAVGGDGTMNEVARGLLHSQMTMGIVPRGSGNGLARHLGIPMDTPSAVESLFNSHVVAIDTFQVNGKLSLNVSGIGFDGHIANLFGKEKKRGFQGYAKHVVKQFLGFREFEAEISTDSVRFKKKAFVIAIANSSQYGNNARIAPGASVCDELLHISFLRKVPLYRLDFVYSFFRGNIGRSAFCNLIETKNMEVKVAAPIAYHIDGEPCGHDILFKIRLVPASLRMLVPKHTLRP